MNPAEERIICGGHSGARAPSDEERAFLTSTKVRQLVEQAHCAAFTTTFDPVLVTTQVVAGANYQVKYNVGSKHVHAKVFQPLPCNSSEPELLSFLDNRTLEDAF
jgi:hypothetical protein